MPSDPTCGGPYIFTDPISGRECELRIGIGVDRLRPGLPGAVVVHGDCRSVADVSPDLDAFHCSTCMRTGRVSGAWVMDLLDPLYDAEASGSPAVGEQAPTPGAAP